MPDPRLLLNNSPVQVPGPAEKPVDQKVVQGEISQIKGTEVYATLAAPNTSSVQYGPLEYTNKPAVGEKCLIAFDASRIGYIVWSPTHTPVYKVLAELPTLPPAAGVLALVESGEETDSIFGAQLYISGFNGEEPPVLEWFTLTTKHTKVAKSIIFASGQTEKGATTPQARIEYVSRGINIGTYNPCFLRLWGSVKVKAGKEVLAGGLAFTLPTGARPEDALEGFSIPKLPVVVEEAGGVLTLNTLTITAAGEALPTKAVKAESVILLEGVTAHLS